MPVRVLSGEINNFQLQSKLQAHKLTFRGTDEPNKPNQSASSNAKDN
jgi:hypothetical protein